MDSLLATSNYTALIVGHIHQYCSGSLSGSTPCLAPANNVKFFVVGNGGAAGNQGGFGYVTVRQNSGGFQVSDYDYSTNAQVATFRFK
jgi:hypothetical protein